MTTGWQRQFAAASRDVRWNEKCLLEDIQTGKLAHKTPLELACEYDLSERKVKRILRQAECKDNLAAFFATISYIAHIIVVTSIERDLSWQETMEAWLDGR